MLVIRRSSNLQQYISAFMAACVLCVSPAHAEPTRIYDDAWLDQRYDWVIYLTPKVLKDFLKYPGSRLNPLTVVNIDTRVLSRLAKNGSDKTRQYEELWYHEARPVGCRRFTSLPLYKGLQGAICIPSGEDADISVPAMANAVVRLLLDIDLANCTLTVVLVPPGMVSKFADALGRFNFKRTSDDSLGGSSIVNLLVSSGDPKDRVFLVYR